MQETPGDARASYKSNLLLGTTTMKIQYLKTNFVRQLMVMNEMDGMTPNASMDKGMIEQHLG
jgi:hypothetical protein